jgi:hypothetical protein
MSQPFLHYFGMYSLFEHQRVVAKLVEAGISRYIGDKIAEQIKLDHEARERNEKAKRTRFAFILRKIARQNGYDISKFI